MAPSPTDQVYAPPGWPGTPLPTNVSVADLPIKDPHCTNDTCTAFIAGFAESERIAPLLSQLEYGKYTVWFYSFWILVFVIIHLYHILSDHALPRKKSRKRLRPSWTHRLVALGRYFTYRRLNGRFGRAIGLRQTSFGVLSLLAFSTAFFTILPWPQHVYLRSLFRFGSPPLSVRCAFIISALTPLLVALAGKVNIITFLTGICYTKLTIFHRYCAYLLFCFSTIHMIPHLISPIRDGGWSMLNQLYKDERRELSGTPLYSTVFSLALLSLPYFRKRAYELFAYTHIFLAIAYLALLCWHTRGEYMSPTYLYATVVIWALTSLIRGLNHPNLFYSRSLTGFPTKLTHLPGRMTRVSVSVPRGMTWKPGQHAFIRLPQISWFANHPFTIASVPARDDEIMDGRKEGNEVVFLVRAQRGFTRRLGEGGLVEGIEETSTSPAGSGVVTPIASNIEIGGDVEKVVQEKVVVRGERKREKEGRVKRLALRTIIDGPYGGHARPLHRLYDTVVCVAGGSGITAVLPQLLTISRAMRDDEVRTTRLHLVWMIRSAEWIGWVREEIKTVLRDARDIKGKARVGIEVFVTAGGEDILVGSEEDVGLRSGSAAEMRKSVEMPICPSPVYGGVGRTKGSRGWSYEMMVAMGNQDQARAVEVGKMESGPVELNEMLMVSYQKPILSGVLGRLVDGNRAIVLSCGPESMKADLSNAVARLQRRVLEGKMQEVALHTETFGW